MTYVRETSIEAYHKIRDDGLLSERRWQVYDVLTEHGPMTGNQSILKFKEKYPHIGINTGAIMTRLSELRDRGVVKELGEVKCPISGHQVILWDVTKDLPANPPRKVSKLEAARARIKELEAKVDELEYKLSRSPEKRVIKKMDTSAQHSLFD